MLAVLLYAYPNEPDPRNRERVWQIQSWRKNTPQPQFQQTNSQHLRSSIRMCETNQQLENQVRGRAREIMLPTLAGKCCPGKQKKGPRILVERYNQFQVPFTVKQQQFNKQREALLEPHSTIRDKAILFQMAEKLRIGKERANIVPNTQMPRWGKHRTCENILRDQYSRLYIGVCGINCQALVI